MLSSSPTILAGSLVGSTTTPLCRLPRMASSSSLVAVMFSPRDDIMTCLRSSMNLCADAMLPLYTSVASCRSSVTTWSRVGTLTSYAASNSYISSTSDADSIVAALLACASACASPKTTKSSRSSGRLPRLLLSFLNDASTLVASSRALSSSRPLMSSMVRCVTGISELRSGRLSTNSTPTALLILSLSITCFQSRCWFMSVRYVRRSLSFCWYTSRLHVCPNR
mmetsp:Transcript_4868/g.12356  ORF Transcript_4868/g.12356 Transcript_4868/m.12356 type:complete len:224 (+) Transcript_4868:1079-1750(+)